MTHSMNKISDELRAAANMLFLSGSNGYNVLMDIADRIDRELVELPKDRDGVPIHVGDNVWEMLGDGEDETVRSITLTGGTAAVTTACHGFMAGVRPNDLTHSSPDSFERIADELEAWCDGADVDGDACDKPRNLAERIRRLASREGER